MIRETRNANRRHVRRFGLGEEPGDDLSRETTVAERLEMVAVLSQRMWELAGREWPSIPRAQWPVRVVRLP